MFSDSKFYCDNFLNQNTDFVKHNSKNSSSSYSDDSKKAGDLKFKGQIIQIIEFSKIWDMLNFSCDTVLKSGQL